MIAFPAPVSRPIEPAGEPTGLAGSIDRPTLSIVIPTLDAAGSIPAVLEALQEARAILPLEVLVVDGGSADGTVRLARECGARVIRAPRGRGTQLRAGAQAASGPWLLFLHADTTLDRGWAVIAKAFIEAPQSASRAAAFRLAFDDPTPQARRVARLANWRSETLKLPYGDQGLLISRAFYETVGGYNAIPLMEDVDLVRRIGRRRLAILPALARTSSARYRRDGWLARPMRNLVLLGLFFLGCPPKMLERLYR
jgi:rSAM/selenodomain-associated transferase 2